MIKTKATRYSRGTEIRSIVMADVDKSGQLLGTWWCEMVNGLYLPIRGDAIESDNEKELKEAFRLALIEGKKESRRK